jgi:hypothetical protein
MTIRRVWLALFAWSVSANAGAVEPLHVKFTLKAVTQGPTRSETSVVLAGEGGAIPILTPGWTCAWLRAQDSLIVECFPRDEDQGVTTAVSCTHDSVASDLAALFVTTRDRANEANDSKTELLLECITK